MLEAELFSLLEHTSDAAFVVTEEGEIRSWNPAAEKLFGYSSAEALTRTSHELLDGFGSMAGASEDGGNFDLQVRTSSGGRLWVNVSTIVFEEPRLSRRLMVHLARDISRRKKNEEAVARILEMAHELTAPSVESGAGAPAAHLSEQERRILRLFSQGENSAGIARELSITLPTLRNHLHSINEKLKTHNRLEAVMHAMRGGLI